MKIVLWADLESALAPVRRVSRFCLVCKGLMHVSASGLGNWRRTDWGRDAAVSTSAERLFCPSCPSVLEGVNRKHRKHKVKNIFN